MVLVTCYSRASSQCNRPTCAWEYISIVLLNGQDIRVNAYLNEDGAQASFVSGIDATQSPSHPGHAQLHAAPRLSDLQTPRTAILHLTGETPTSRMATATVAASRLHPARDSRTRSERCAYPSNELGWSCTGDIARRKLTDQRRRPSAKYRSLNARQPAPKIRRVRETALLGSHQVCRSLLASPLNRSMSPNFVVNDPLWQIRGRAHGRCRFAHQGRTRVRSCGSCRRWRTR